MFGRTKIAGAVAEFLGVATLVLTILAVSKSGVGFSVFIAASVGVAASGLALAFGPRMNVQFNPAVTLGLWTSRRLTTLHAAVAIAAQFLGGAVALKLYEYLANQPINSIANKAFDWRILVAEGVGAMLVGFIVAAAVYQRYVGVRLAAAFGGAFFVGALVASLAANGLVNPAVALGVRSWSRAYTLGPLLGGVIGVNLYAYLFAEQPASTDTTASDADSADAPTKKRLLRRKSNR